MRAFVPEFPRSVGENAGRATGDVWNGSMLLKNELKGRIEQLRFKKCVEHATLVQTTFCPDSIVVRSAFATGFFNSIGQSRRFDSLPRTSARR